MTNPRILVVEDDLTARNALADLLRDEGYDVAAVGRGRDAVVRARDWRPSLAVIDLRLPDMDGFQVIRELRVAAPGCHSVLMSGVTSLEGDGSGGFRFRDPSVEAREAGALAYLVKPIDVDELFDIVSTAVSPSLQVG